MNLILLHPEDLRESNQARLSGRRLEHIRTVQQAAIGDTLRVGLLNGRWGRGTILELNHREVLFSLDLDQPPPAPLPLSLILALPRPKMLKRILQAVTTLGVKQIYLINSYRVDKSYWSSPLLQKNRIREHLILGLEQARDTRLPQVHLRPRFKPFVEDELPAIARATRAYVAHPQGPANAAPVAVDEGKTTLAVGPEGGFIAYEIEKFQAAGFTPLSLGERILRVETAVPVLISRLTSTPGKT